MKHLIASLVVVGVLAGCGPTQEQAKLDAAKRWSHTRSQVACSVGIEQLKCGQLDRAYAKAQESLALDPDMLPARVLLGRVYIEQGQYANAVEELTRVEQATPGDSEVHYLLAIAREKDGKLDEALADYRKALALKPGRTDAVMAIVEVLVAQNKLGEAAQNVEAYANQTADDPGLYELGGRIAMMQGNYPKAQDYYQQACDMCPKHVGYAECLARAQFQCGNYRESASTITQLLASADYKPQAWVLVMLGDCCLAQNKVQAARDQFIAATRAEPGSAMVWLGLAKASLAAGDSPRASMAARQALAIDSENLDAHVLLGYALLRQSDARGAVDVLKDAVVLAPQDVTLRCVLGKAQAAAGDKKAARASLRAALETEPGNTLAKTLLVSLDK